MINEPYAGCYVPTKHYGNTNAATGLMIEIRRDVYVDADLNPLPKRVAQLGAALTRLIDAT